MACSKTSHRITSYFITHLSDSALEIVSGVFSSCYSLCKEYFRKQNTLTALLLPSIGFHCVSTKVL